MAINFPNPATLNQSYTVGTKTWIYNGYAWDLVLANTTPILNVAISAYDQANTGVSIGQAAFGQANSGFTQANAAYVQANTAVSIGQGAFSQANAAYVRANTGVSIGQGAFDQANSGFTQANAAYTQANTGVSIGQGAFTQANAAYAQANTGVSIGQAAFGQANSGFTQANSAYAQANTGVSIGQGAFGQANSAYVQANTAVSIGQGAFAQANSGFSQANAAYTQANSAYTQANTGITLTQSVFNQANAAYNTANTKFSSSGGTISGSVTITTDLNVTGNVYLNGNVTTLSSNNLSINDPLIYLAQNNPANLQDIGLVGHFTSDHYQHTGLVRDASDGIWKLFSNVSVEPTQTIDFTTAVYDTIQVGTLISSNAAFNVPSGAAPFTVNSVTLVSNLNADQLDGQHGNYYTGLSNAANTQANLGIAIGQGAFGQANSAFTQANSAYNQANTGITTGQAAFTQANSAYNQANTGITTGQNAFAQANAAYSAANTVSIINYPIIRPSLLLDFANRKKLDPRITFTRASTATYTDFDGLIKTAASGAPRFDFNPTTGESLGLLIEEQRTNLLTYSENLENRTIVRAMVVSNATTAPDGTMTADKLVANTTNSDHFAATGALSGTSSSTIYTVSCYVKAAELYRLTLDICDSSDYITTRLRGDFNLNAVTGTVTVGTGTCAIVPVGNSWYRISVSGAAKAGSSAVVECIITLMNNSGQLAFVGNNIDGIYIWGAQLEAGAFSTSYIPSADSFTSRASSGSFIGSNGLIQSAATNIARYSYNPLNLALAPKLLLEPAATNLLTYSEQFDNPIWENQGNLGIAVTANNVISPDGTTSADKITNDAGSTSLFEYRINVPASSTNDYTASIFVKAGTATNFVFNCYYLNNTEDNILFDLTTGTVLGGNTPANRATIIAIGNGWYRVSFVLTRDATGTRTTLLFRGWGISSGSRGNGVIGEYYYAWGAQLETGTSATSYIQTTSAQVTRAADVSSSAQATRAADNAVMTGTNFSSWYRQDEGAVFVKYEMAFNGSDYYPSAWYITDNTFNNRFGHSVSAGQKNCNYDSLTNSAVQLYLSLGTVPSTVSSAYTYKQNDFAGSVFGQAVVTDTLGIQPIVNTLHIGSRLSGAFLNGHIAKLAYYPKRLTNAELQAITTV